MLLYHSDHNRWTTLCAMFFKNRFLYLIPDVRERNIKLFFLEKCVKIKSITILCGCKYTFVTFFILFFSDPLAESKTIYQALKQPKGSVTENGHVKHASDIADELPAVLAEIIPEQALNRRNPVLAHLAIRKSHCQANLRRQTRNFYRRL